MTLRRGRRSIRTRLAVRYALVAFVTGALLLTFSYVVVHRQLLPSTPVPSLRGNPGLTVRPTGSSNRPGERLQGTISSADSPASDRRSRSTATVEILQAVEVRDRRVLRKVLLSLGAALVLMTLVSAWLGWLLAGRALAPVARITAAARRVTQRNLHERIALGGPNDELRELADTFDGMLDKLDDAFESEQQFVANASHELRTPLAVVRATIDVSDDSGSLGGQGREMTRKIRRALDRAERLVDRLLLLARSDQPLDGRETVHLGSLARRVVAEQMDDGRAAGLDLQLDVRTRDDLSVAGDPILLATLAGNLIDNAIRYNQPQGRISVTVGVTRDEAAEAIELRVENDGERLPPESVEGLLRPFRRAAGRTGQGGFGLGLSLVDAIARAHGGTVTLSARPAGGLLVVVRIPRLGAYLTAAGVVSP